ncbi:MAG: MoaD/ThiS family protein [Desulfobacteraceae bacterium]|nr:MoaD/ThiS family protein [Desulfobacteraceae bacterium]
MIKVIVKLYGTLPERIQAYDPDKGLILEFAQGTKVADLTQRLNLAAEDTGVVALDGRVAAPETSLYDGAQIRIFQAAYGG